MNTPLTERYDAVLERLYRALQAAGRKKEEVRLIAVSKLHPAAAVADIAACGQTDFGENYVQEALEKRATLEQQGVAALRWHMIGHVQSRKAALVAGDFALVHTLDSQKLANAFERRLAELQKIQPVLVEINIGQESQKAGIAEEDALPLIMHVLEHCPHLSIQGLMCLPPVFDAGDAARPYFARLYALREQLRQKTGLELPHLSMGMSGDFEAAIAEGATLVRVGTDIFGARPSKK